MGHAIYLCVVTATTVGYGDVGVRDTPGQRLFASFHILYSVSSAAALLNTVSMLSAERKLQLRKSSLLKRQLDMDLIASLDKDNNGLDKLEFVVGMLTKLEILHWDDVEPFLAQFDAMDKDRSGRLDREDLMRMVEDRKHKVEQMKQRKATVRLDAAIAALPQDMDGGQPQMTAVEKMEASDVETYKQHRGGPPESSCSMSREYGGIAAHNRELAAAGLPQTAEAEAGRRPRQRTLLGGLNVPFVLMSQKNQRIRRPTHLRSKITPG